MHITWNIYLLRFFFRFLLSIFFFIFVFSFKGEPTTMVADLLQMSRHGGTGTEALKNGIDKIFEKEGHLPIQNYNEKMVSFTSDGASANTGQNECLMTRMKSDRRDWLAPIHCVNHRVELVIKDSFDESPFSAVHRLYITLFNLFKNMEPLNPTSVRLQKFLKYMFILYQNLQVQGLSRTTDECLLAY